MHSALLHSARSVFSVPERLSLYQVFQKVACATFKELKRFVSLYPMSKQIQSCIVHYELCIDTASCTTSVYVNLSKNSFFHTKRPPKWAKADAKVHNIPIPSKFLANFFQDLTKVFDFIDKIITYTLLIIYKV